MKSFTPFFLAALASQASAHYIFERLTHGGTEYAVYQYIRENTNYNSPVIDLTSNDLRCNVGGEDNTVGNTATITMVAGDSFTFTTDVAVYHDGPLSIYMSKAPSTAASYDGSGQWFKILDIGPDFSSGSAVWNLAQSYTYTIPKALPSGDYLLRIQQLGIHNPYPAGIPQFYIGCAQVTVTGGGSGTPGPLVSIPGFIKGDEPGYVVNIYTDFTNYTVPGPAVWSGQNAAGSGGATTSPTNPTTTAKTTSTVAGTTSTTAAAPTGAVVPKYGQCGGIGWSGGTVCAAGSTCTVSSSYYSQCL